MPQRGVIIHRQVIVGEWNGWTWVNLNRFDVLGKNPKESAWNKVCSRCILRIVPWLPHKEDDNFAVKDKEMWTSRILCT